MTRLVRAAACAAATLAILSVASAAYAAVTPVAALWAVGQANEFGDLSVSGETLVSGVDVFTESSGGWSDGSQAATLSDPTGGVLGGSSISGQTIVLSDTTSPGQGAEDVFVEPSGGWSGTLLPAARLVAPAGETLGGAVISGSTIVAFGSPFAGSRVLYVFAEPPGGWSGVLGPVATLADSGGASFPGGVELATSGNAVFVSTVRGVDVFTEPSGGWGGVLNQSATLVGATNGIGVGESQLLVSGNMVLAGHSLFRRPPGGWTGSVKPVANVYPTSADEQGSLEAFSGSMIAVATTSPATDVGCPCGARVSLFTEPSGGWSGTLTAPPAFSTTTDTGGLGVAIEGQYLFWSGGTVVSADRVTGSAGSRAAPPTVTSRVVSGLTSGKPRLELGIAARGQNPPIDALTITLPRGLSFTTSHTRLTRGVSIGGATGKYTIAVEHGRLVVTFAAFASRPRVEIKAPALFESKNLLSRARVAAMPRQGDLDLRGTLRVTDVTGESTASSVMFGAR
jgi:hypothetical protein